MRASKEEIYLLVVMLFVPVLLIILHALNKRGRGTI